MRIGLFALASIATLRCFGQNGVDRSPHKVQFVTVETNVRLEVLDWGGSGRSVVLLAGLGDTAHTFDEFAPKLAGDYHVYGITRRGFGASSSAETGYAADQLGDDVVAVLDSLKLSRPILLGHSAAGEELSSVGTRHPEKVAGLIYIDAGYSYAYYNSTRGDFFDEPRYFVDLAELRRKLSRLMGDESQQLNQELLKTDLPQFQKDLQERQNELDLESRLGAAAPRASSPPEPSAEPATNSRSLAIMAGLQKYTEIRVPVLAMYAVPIDLSSIKDPAVRAAAEAREGFREEQVKAFEKGLPQARVVRMPHAKHAIWRSNEEDVLREIHAFIGGLP
jgi:non-heme chloroperoxidase